MNEGGDRSCERRPPHVSTRDWASLLPELVQGIADCVLTTSGGVDAYMYMRGVCPSWRSAISRPSPLAAVAELRFRPRHWVMVNTNQDDDAQLFLHIPTGRFCRLRLPVLRDHTLVGATDGLLVLGDREPPHLAHVLNPFTGDMLHYAAALPEHCKNNLGYISVDGGSHSMLVLMRWGALLCAAPTSHIFTEKNFAEEDPEAYLISMVNFDDNVYCADPGGCVYKFVERAEQYDQELVIIADVLPDVDVSTEGDDSGLRSFLVESGGELLLVRYVDRSLKVFRVNVKHNSLEVVNSLGGRALFLGAERCVSVDADKLPSVDGDCVYMLDFMLDFEDKRDMCVHNLRGEMVDIISREKYLDRPFSLVQVLLRYCDFHDKL